MNRWIVVAMISAASAASADVPGITGYWPLNGHTADLVGGINGVTNGTLAFTRNGIVGKSGTFNGSNTRVGMAAPVINTNAYSKSAWIRMTSGATPNNILSSFTNGQHAFWAPVQYTNRLSSGHNGTWNYVQDNVGIPTGVWQHVVVTYDRGLSNGTMKLYRNGVPVGGKPSATNVPLPNGAADLQIGGHGTGNLFTGDIDDCALWPRAITDAEVQELYTNGLRRVGATRMTNNILARVPEALEFSTLYEYDIPLAANLGAAGLPDYQADFTASYTGRVSFDRVAYYVEFQPTNAGAAMQWAYVSMNPFATRASLLGIPCQASGAFFQQVVTSMNVFASGGVTTGTNIQTGNIEFWGLNYTTNNSLPVPNASSSTYDFGDQPVTSGYYGSMQIHNFDVDGAGPGVTGQTLIAFNRWGTTGNGDLGIGTSATVNPDWTFRQNMATYSLRNLIVLVRQKLLPDVDLTAWPRDLQVVPRSPATGRGTVLISGLVRTSTVDQLTLDVTRNGSAWTSLVQSVTVTTSAVPFAMAVEIPAEFASYGFLLTVRDNGTNFIRAQAVDVVAGDFYLINGQSNAEAVQYTGSANGYQSPWVRSFGTREENAVAVSNDLSWRIAEGNLGLTSAAVGQWALRMGRALADTNGVPVALINGARGGQPINYFRRNDAVREDLNNNYGRLLYRVRQAGALTNALAMLWYQGESDVGMADIHERGFARLLDNWREDFPGLNRFYVFQVREGCSGIVLRNDMPLRERQRLMQDRYPGVTVLTTSGFNANNGCHYDFTNGYEAIGLYAARVLARDIHGFAQPQIDAPNPAHAWISQPDGSEITIATRATTEQLQWQAVGGAGPEADFVVNGAAVTVTNGYATNNTIVLQLSGSAAGATGVMYVGHAGVVTNGWVVNGAGVGLLTFGNLPLAAGTNPPVAVSGAVAYPIASNRIDLAWPAVSGAGSYRIERDGAVVGTAWETIFVDGTLTNTGVHAYRIAAASPFGTSAWSAVFSATNAIVQATVPVTELADFELLYLLEPSDELALGAALPAPYQINRATGFTQAFDRVAYVMEGQARPGEGLSWVAASFDPPTNVASRLGVPTLLSGVVLEQFVTNLNVQASAGVPATPVLHSANGFIEFWGHNYSSTTNSSIPGASTTLYDADDTRSGTGDYGSMQIHNVNADGAGRVETVLAFNRWGQATVDDWGLGTNPTNNPDWTFSQSATNYGLRRLAVLVRTDADGDGLPDAWERARFGTTTNAPGDDADGDGVSNAAEYLADTHPSVATSFPFVAIGRAGGTAELRFGTSAARRYQLDYTTNLAVDAWTPFNAEQDGTGGAVSLIETNGADVQRSYRLKIRVP